MAAGGLERPKSLLDLGKQGPKGILDAFGFLHAEIFELHAHAVLAGDAENSGRNGQRRLGLEVDAHARYGADRKRTRGQDEDPQY